MAPKAKPQILTSDSQPDLWNKVMAGINAKAIKNGLPADKQIVQFASDMAIRKRISMANPILDYILGGGLKVGTSSSHFGPPGAGKTSALLEWCVYITTVLEGYAGWIQAEEGDIRDQAEMMGMDMSKFVVLNVRGSGQQAFDQITALLEDDNARKLGLKGLVMDSLAGLSPKNEIDKTTDKGMEEGSSGVGEVARMFSQWYRILHARKLFDDIHMAFITQVRTKIGMYGSSMGVVGGLATEHGPRLRLAYSQGEAITAGTGVNKHQIGHQVKVVVKKDGVTHRNQGREVMYKVIYGKGNDQGYARLFLLKEFDAFDIGGGGNYVTRPELLDLIPEGEREPFIKIRGEANVELLLAEAEPFRTAADIFIERARLSGAKGTETEEESEDDTPDTDFDETD